MGAFTALSKLKPRRCNNLQVSAKELGKCVTGKQKQYNLGANCSQNYYFCLSSFCSMSYLEGTTLLSLSLYFLSLMHKKF